MPAPPTASPQRSATALWSRDPFTTRYDSLPAAPAVIADPYRPSRQGVRAASRSGRPPRAKVIHVHDAEMDALRASRFRRWHRRSHAKSALWETVGNAVVALRDRRGGRCPVSGGYLGHGA